MVYQSNQPVMKKIILLIAAFSINGAVNAQNNLRALTSAEEGFVQKIESNMQQVLNKAAGEMTGKWIIKFSVDPYMGKQIDKYRHDGRPHQFRCSLSMEYVPTDKERVEMDREINNYYKVIGNREPNAAERLHDPTLKYSINISAVVNDYGFEPVDLQKAAGLGGAANIPGTVASMFRTKDLGTGVPYYSLYMGDYKKTNSNGVEKLVENFTPSPECTNVRTVNIDVHSSLSVAQLFISKLDLAAINRMILEW